MEIAEATFYRWKKVYASISMSEIRRLKQLEDENGKLKRLVADPTLDKTMLQDALRKSSEACPPAARSSGTIRMFLRCLGAGLAGLWGLGRLLTDINPGVILKLNYGCG